jgi:PAS domain-containing protein
MRRPDPAGTLDALSRTFLDSALDCIITMDASGRVQEFNPASERVSALPVVRQLAKSWLN